MAEPPTRPPITSSLEDIAKYTVSAERIRQRVHYILFTFYTYANEFIAALAGIGIGYPLLTKATTGAAGQPSPDLSSLTPGVILAIVWVLLKVSVMHDDGLKRATLMKSCRKEMLTQRSRVEREALTQVAPGVTLEDILKKLSAIYDRHNQENSWPWLGGFAPKIEQKTAKEVKTWLTSWQKRYPTPVNVAEEDLRRE